jgi:hypothetical protein
MSILFKGLPWRQWIVQKEQYLIKHIDTHLDEPEIQTLPERKTNSYQRSLFYAHGMIRYPTDFNIHTYATGKINPWDGNKSAKWKIIIRDPTYLSYLKKYKIKTNSSLSQCIVEFQNDMTNEQLATILSSFPLQTFEQKYNYTIENPIDLLFPTKSVIPIDNTKKYYCFVDTGTTRSDTVVLPELLIMKDIAYVISDQDGTIVAQNTCSINMSQQVSINLFFIQWLHLLYQYRAEIVAYNGAFDAVMLSRYNYNPISSQLLKLWNHDCMYITQLYLNLAKPCSLENAYKKCFEKDPPLKLHISINDAITTKDVFCFLIKN